MAARDGVAKEVAKEIVIERVFDAPRERVFDVFTQPEHLRKWWGPKGMSVPIAEFEARPGGRIFLGQRAPDGAMHYNAGVVREIERPSRIVFTIYFADADRRRVAPPAGVGLPATWDEEIVTLRPSAPNDHSHPVGLYGRVGRDGAHRLGGIARETWLRHR